MNNTFYFDAPDEQATVLIGRALGQTLRESFSDSPIIVALIGPLGAGKTCFVKAVAQAAGVENETVSSPTFVLVHEYSGALPIYHFDAYRLKSEAEFVALGPEEYFSRPGWSFIEWADRVNNCLPANRLEITIESETETTRRFMFRALGPQHKQLLTELINRLPKETPSDSAST